MNTSKTILIVEDESGLREALADKITSEGYQVIQGEDGVEGLEKARTHHPDLILLDIKMPRMDGLTLIERLRTEVNDYGKRFP